jgi:VanZ family protein
MTMDSNTTLLILGFCIVMLGCLAPKHWVPALPNDKLLHFLAFGGLGMLIGRMVNGEMELIGWLLALFVGGCLIEVMQQWVPGRSFCWRDIAANSAGIAAAGIVESTIRL